MPRTVDVNSRMNRLVGQIEGIRRMINSGRKTEDVVQQILAAREAISKVGVLILKDETIQMTQDAHKKRYEKLLEKIFRI